jgi:hypothetical protein
VVFDVMRRRFSPIWAKSALLLTQERHFFAELWQIAPTAYAAKQLILLKVFKC